MAEKWSAQPEKSTIVDDDKFLIIDSEDINDATKSKQVPYSVVKSDLADDTLPFGGFGNFQNFITFSEDFGEWSTFSSAEANLTSIPAPNKTLTTWELDWTVATSIFGFRLTGLNFVALAEYTLSFWAKSLEGNNQLRIDLGDGGNANILVDTDTFKRYSVNITSGNANTFIDLKNNPDTGKFLIWGMQLVDGHDNNFPYSKTSGKQIIAGFGATASKQISISGIPQGTKNAATKEFTSTQSGFVDNDGARLASTVEVNLASGSLQGVTVINGGIDFEAGDIVTFTGGGGTGATGEVVLSGSSIIDIDFDVPGGSRGINYNNDGTLTVFGENGSGASLTAIVGVTPAVIDGIAVVTRDRVLLKDQNSKRQNGIYDVDEIADPSTWERSNDSNVIAEINNSSVIVVEGDTNAGKVFLQTAAVGVLNNDDVIYEEPDPIGKVGTGLELTGSVLSVDQEQPSRVLDFDDTRAYAEKELVLQDNLTYRNITPVAASGGTPFDADDWIPVGGTGTKGTKHIFSEDDFPPVETVIGVSGDVHVLENGIEYILADNIDLVDGGLFMEIGVDVQLNSFSPHSNKLNTSVSGLMMLRSRNNILDFDNVETPGELFSVIVTGSSDYNNGESVTFEGLQSGSTTATGTIVTDGSGIISSVNVDAGSTGYQDGEDIEITGGDSGETNAIATGNIDLDTLRILAQDTSDLIVAKPVNIKSDSGTDYTQLLANVISIDPDVSFTIDSAIPFVATSVGTFDLNPKSLECERIIFSNPEKNANLFDLGFTRATTSEFMMWHCEMDGFDLLGQVRDAESVVFNLNEFEGVTSLMRFTSCKTMFMQGNFWSETEIGGFSLIEIEGEFTENAVIANNAFLSPSNGSIQAIDVLDGGTGHGTGNVALTGVTSGATNGVGAIVESGGVIQSITLINRGTGYIDGEPVTTDSTGTGESLVIRGVGGYALKIKGSGADSIGSTGRLVIESNTDLRPDHITLFSNFETDEINESDPRLTVKNNPRQIDSKAVFNMNLQDQAVTIATSDTYVVVSTPNWTTGVSNRFLQASGTWTYDGLTDTTAMTIITIEMASVDGAVRELSAAIFRDLDDSNGFNVIPETEFILHQSTSFNPGTLTIAVVLPYPVGSGILYQLHIKNITSNDNIDINNANISIIE